MTYRQRGALPSPSDITGGLDVISQRLYDRQKRRYRYRSRRRVLRQPILHCLAVMA